MVRISVIGIYCLLVMAVAIAQQKVYKHVDSSGRVTFSDRPQEGSEEIEVTPLQSFKSQPAASSTTTILLDEQAIQNNPFQYERLEIVEPSNGETLWNNLGNVTVDVALKPKLRSGDHVELLLDGGVVQSSTGSMRFELKDISRGEHTLTAQVKNKNGEVVLTSPSSTIFLHQASINMPAR